jgi:hypothetical protein
MDSEKLKKLLPKWLFFAVAIAFLMVAGISMCVIVDSVYITKQPVKIANLEFGPSVTEEQVKKLELELNEKRKELNRLTNEQQGADKVKLNTDIISEEAEKQIKETVLKLEEKNKELETLKIKIQKTEKQNHDLKINIKDLKQKIIAMKRTKELNIKEKNKEIAELKDKCRKKIKKYTKLEKGRRNYTNPLSIILTNPVNGRERARAGEQISVEGTMNDKKIKEAHLLLNNKPVPIKVYRGRFKKNIFLPDTEVVTFRVLATGSDGIISYSSLHTVSLGEKINIPKQNLF